MDEKKSMGRGQYQRKLRRIDYSKEEVAKMANCASSTLDDKIKKFCETYGFPEGAFKQVDHTGRNFFPPEYTPLLALLLKYDAENPSTTEAKRNHATAEDVAQYNRDILSGIDQSKETTLLLKTFLMEMPWYRTAEIMSVSLSTLVQELQILVCNLLFTSGTDVGEGIKQFIRYLDQVNFNMYLGKFLRDSLTQSSAEQQRKFHAELAEELDGMSEEERKNFFRENPKFEDIYLEYKGKLDAAEIPVDERSLSVDQGIANTIRLMMKYYRTEIIQEGRSTLQNFLADEAYAELEKELRDAGRSETPQEVERKHYLLGVECSLVKYLDSYRTPGIVDAVVRNGRVWKSCAEKFENDEPIEINRGQELTPDDKCYALLKEAYLDFIKTATSKEYIKTAVSNLTGSVLANYFFDSGKI